MAWLSGTKSTGWLSVSSSCDWEAVSLAFLYWLEFLRIISIDIFFSAEELLQDKPAGQVRWTHANDLTKKLFIVWHYIYFFTDQSSVSVWTKSLNATRYKYEILSDSRKKKYLKIDLTLVLWDFFLDHFPCSSHQ